MNKERLRKLADNPRIIPGIYNYCDRWCEKCAFTSRCMNYAIEADEPSDPASRDISNSAFWARLGETFKTTLVMVKEMAAEMGVDLADTGAGGAESAAAAAAREREVEEARGHPCATGALEYARMVERWFEADGGRFEEKSSEVEAKLALGLSAEDAEKEIGALRDTMETLRWYQHFLYPKLMRAIESAIHERVPASAADNGMQRDSDGSAKVALIAADRSIEAWTRMRATFPEHEDGILDIMVHLGRLRRGIETAFPRARAFVRPGFDEAPAQGEGVTLVLATGDNARLG